MLRRIQALVIEDTEIGQRVAKMALERLGCIARCVATGHEALEKIHKQAYDIIFMDFGLKDIKGILLAKHIRDGTSLNKDIPIVALTANPGKDIWEQIEMANMNGYLGKPFELAEMKTLIEALVPDKK